jgi:4-hydroxy-2-oxoheptanedioate aldolase
MRSNTVLRKLRAGEPSVGTWLSCSDSLAAELMAHVGFDWLVINMEHEAIDVRTMQMMLQAISTTDTIPMVRPVWNDILAIKQPLDCGAYGVVIPMVNSREDAIRAVQVCRYPPQGIRGIGGARRSLYGGPDYVAHANEEIAVIVQIETTQALANADEIMSVEGIDAFFIGPNDLAKSMGLSIGLDNRHPDFMRAVKHLLEVGKRHGVPGGIHAGTPSAVNEMLDLGFQFVAMDGDIAFMMQAARQSWSQVKVAAGREEAARAAKRDTY